MVLTWAFWFFTKTKSSFTVFDYNISARISWKGSFFSAVALAIMFWHRIPNQNVLGKAIFSAVVAGHVPTLLTPNSMWTWRHFWHLGCFAAAASHPPQLSKFIADLHPILCFLPHLNCLCWFASNSLLPTSSQLPLLMMMMQFSFPYGPISLVCELMEFVAPLGGGMSSWEVWQQ